MAINAIHTFNKISEENRELELELEKLRSKIKDAEGKVEIKSNMKKRIDRELKSK